MYNLISTSMGEIALKGKNRGYFERLLESQIKDSVEEFEYDIFKDQGKIYISPKNKNDMDAMIEKIRKVFGIVILSPCIRVEKNEEVIKDKLIELFGYLKDKYNYKSFKIVTKRVDKTFPHNSPEFNKILGGIVLDNFDDVHVDVHNPDVYVYVDIKKDCYLYSERVKTVGGMPKGTNGKGLLLLSGGIDSPVAAYMLARRGLEIEALYFHTYPFSSERANQKVKDLAKLLAAYTGTIKLHSVNMLEFHKAVKENCDIKNTTILARRFMMRIAEIIARKDNCDVLITGESLGQVASQTIQSMLVIEEAIDIPIFKPVIGMDKTDIVDISKEIGTFETSIQPFEDCCSIFAPKHPVTKPKLEHILRQEERLDFEELIATCMETIEVTYEK